MPSCTATGVEAAPRTTAKTPGPSYFLDPDPLRAWWMNELLCFLPQNPSGPAPAPRTCPMDRVSPALSDHRL
jgi:hypothetical protein